jgi:hypothetical protein
MMKLTDERSLGLSQEVDSLLAKGMSYTQIVENLLSRGYGKNEIEHIAAERISLRAAHQPFVLKKKEESASSKNDENYVWTEKAPSSSVWETLGGFGSGLVLIVLAGLAILYAGLTGDVYGIAAALGLVTVAILNMTSDYRGMW